MGEVTTAVNCERVGHCPHEGTAVGSFYCCKCNQYLYNLTKELNSDEAPYPKFVREQMALIDAHPEWGMKYL